MPEPEAIKSLTGSPRHEADGDSPPGAR